MKSYKLSELIFNIAQFKSEKCPAGYTVEEWLEAGNTSIRWDTGRCTYQINFGIDSPVWAFGNRVEEILSPYYLVGIFKRLFPTLDLKFNDATFKMLLIDRIRSLPRITGEDLESLTDNDNEYRTHPDSIIVSDELMLRAYVCGRN